jgi:hypothetical protein
VEPYDQFGQKHVVLHDESEYLEYDVKTVTSGNMEEIVHLKHIRMMQYRIEEGSHARSM